MVSSVIRFCVSCFIVELFCGYSALNFIRFLNVLADNGWSARSDTYN